jgi:hypothetical protein
MTSMLSHFDVGSFDADQRVGAMLLDDLGRVILRRDQPPRGTASAQRRGAIPNYPQPKVDLRGQELSALTQELRTDVTQGTSTQGSNASQQSPQTSNRRVEIPDHGVVWRDGRGGIHTRMDYRRQENVDA